MHYYVVSQFEWPANMAPCFKNKPFFNWRVGKSSPLKLAILLFLAHATNSLLPSLHMQV
jgi:hypothetical protein